MSNRARVGVRAATGLWAGTLLLLGFGAWNRLGLSPMPGPLPQVGQELALADVESTFGLEPATRHDRWFVALGSGCPASLARIRNLTDMKAAADCQGAELVPLVIVDTADADPLVSLLMDRGFASPAVADISGAEVLRIASVPTILKVDRMGRIVEVASPSMEGSWPPELGCPVE